MKIPTTFRLALTALIPLAMLTACEREPPEEMVQQIESLEAERDELRAQAQELDEVRATLQALEEDLRDLDLPEELREEDDPPLQTQADTLRAMVRATGRSLEEARSQLQSARGQAAVLQRRADSIRAAHEETVADLEGRLDREEERAAALQAQVQELTSATRDLESELAALSASFESLDEEAHRAYYVAGQREELLRQGVVTREGGARVLFLLWRRGETLVPAADPDPNQFTAIDRRAVQEIPLPRTDVRYRVVSPHSLEYAEASTGDGGTTVRGEAIQVTDPDRFWRVSPFLILVEAGS